jgi:hypothetical protein
LFIAGTTATEAAPPSADEIRRLIYDYMSWEIVVNALEAVIQALEIEAI